MVAVATDDILSQGIYTRKQAAYLSRLRPQMVTRWFDAGVGKGPVVRRMMPDNGAGVVSFVDLIQLMAVRSIRLERHISLQKIRETTNKAEQMGFPFPLARATRVYLFDDTVVLKLPDGTMIEATGRFAKHYIMEPVVLPYLEDVTFDDTNGLAREYRPSTAVGVVLNPSRQWGAPVVESCNYTVETLVAAVRAEGSITAAAAMCEVSEDEVRTALRYEDVLRGDA